MACMIKRQKVPDGELIIVFEFGVSSNASDWDNPVKPAQDIIQDKFDFNDSRIKLGISRKVLVPKGKEYVKFSIYPYKDIFNEILNLLNK